MAEYRKDRYYWFKLKEDFFKRHDIKIIKAMPNGKDYVIFYLQLLCESLAHSGRLRFSDTIPYDENMLSVVTDTNIDIVRSAMKLFTELHLIEILDDRTIYMSALQNMVGSTTVGAERKQLQRKNRAPLIEGGQKGDKCPPEIEKEIELEIDIDNYIEDSSIPPTPPQTQKEDEKPKQKRFTPPTLEEVRQYCKDRKNNVDAERFINHYTSNGWKVGKNKMKNWQAAVRTWERSRFDNQPNNTNNEDYASLLKGGIDL